MRRVVALLGLGALMVAVASSGILSGISSASTPKSAPQHVTVIAKEFSFKLSAKSVKTGTVIFTVKNEGHLEHDFAIAGKKTPLIAPGKSASLTVTFKRKGQFKYSCTVPGHAAAGMEGVLPVAVSLKSTTTTPTTPTTTTSASTTTTANPGVGTAQTTVDVSIVEFSFTLTVNGQSTASVHSGQVTFVITNNGKLRHNFDLEGVHAGALLSPGQSETWTVTLPPGHYTYQCDVPGHAALGLLGYLTVFPGP
jgi:uncharacterized cupredoxin-like copper-binding protein